MTTPRVIELPRRLEATSADTFLGVHGPDLRPLAQVVALRPRDRRPHSGRISYAALSLVVGPDDDAA